VVDQHHRLVHVDRRTIEFYVHHLSAPVALSSCMAGPVKARGLSDEEGRQVQRIVRRGGDKTHKSIVKGRRALVVLATAGGNDVAAIARSVRTSPDRVREMIHSFIDKGRRALDPPWAGGRPRRITTEQRHTS
jgi:hypothetical protein